MNKSKNLLALSLVLLLAAAVVGVLNGTKVKNLRSQVTDAAAQRQAAGNRQAAAEKGIKAREAKAAAQFAKTTDHENRVAEAEGELVKTQTEKSDLQSKLQANETQISELQKRIEELSKAPANPNPGAPSAAELQAQLDEARKQLENAENEKSLIAEKMQPSVPPGRLPLPAVRRNEPTFHGSLRGTVLAVNHAYNFVVLNLGGRQGVETNAELLVLRSGSLIGKIRISSVEPATAIGDILSGSLARGVQVQPGDTVIYAGSNS